MFKNYNIIGCISGIIVGFLLTFIALVLSVIMVSWIPFAGFILFLFITAILPFFPKLRMTSDLNVGVLIGLILATVLALFLWELFIFSSDE